MRCETYGSCYNDLDDLKLINGELLGDQQTTETAETNHKFDIIYFNANVCMLIIINNNVDIIRHTLSKCVIISNLSTDNFN